MSAQTVHVVEHAYGNPTHMEYKDTRVFRRKLDAKEYCRQQNKKHYGLNTYTGPFHILKTTNLR